MDASVRWEWGVMAGKLVTLKLTALGTRRGQVHAEGEQPRVAGVVDADGDGYGEVFLTVDQGEEAGTTVRVVLPPYATSR